MFTFETTKGKELFPNVENISSKRGGRMIIRVMREF